MNQLVLSLFPGIGLLDMAFEEEGFCIVRGPDLLWGGDVRKFHPPAGRFDGVIGGPPCQSHSRFRYLVEATGKKPRHQNLIPEFERCVGEAGPNWFLMENVEGSPLPRVPGYATASGTINNRWLGEEQNRKRVFTFGLIGSSLRGISRDRSGQPMATGFFGSLSTSFCALENPSWCSTILASGGRRPGFERSRGRQAGRRYGYSGPGSLTFALKAQGLPDDFLADSPFSATVKFGLVGNGVPLPMGRAIARAVKQALGYSSEVSA